MAEIAAAAAVVADIVDNVEELSETVAYETYEDAELEFHDASEVLSEIILNDMGEIEDNININNKVPNNMMITDIGPAVAAKETLPTTNVNEHNDDVPAVVDSAAPTDNDKQSKAPTQNAVFDVPREAHPSADPGPCMVPASQPPQPAMFVEVSTSTTPKDNELSGQPHESKDNPENSTPKKNISIEQPGEVIPPPVIETPLVIVDSDLDEQEVIIKKKNLLSVITKEKTYAGKKKSRTASTPKSTRKKKLKGVNLSTRRKEKPSQEIEIQQLRDELIAMRKAMVVMEKKIHQQEEEFTRKLKEELDKRVTCPRATLIETMAEHMDEVDKKIIAVETHVGKLDLEMTKINDVVLDGANKKEHNGIDEKKDEETKEEKKDEEKVVEEIKEAKPKDEKKDKPKHNNGGEGQRYSNTAPHKKKKILMMMDSNRRHLNEDLLWENLTLIQVGNIPDLHKTIAKQNLPDFDVVVLHVGVNDIDTTTGETVAQKLIHVTSKIKKLAPGITIVLSEVTPRKTKDEEVISCNNKLHEILDTAENITLARHSNLRNEEWSHHRDDRHISESSTARLAGNLKAAFRKAIGAGERSERPYKKGGFSGQRGNKPGRKYMNNNLSTLKTLLENLFR